MTDKTKTKTRAQKWVYNGGRDAIDVKLPTGRWITCRRGEAVSVLPNEARALRTLPGWSPAPTPTSLKETE